MANSSDPRQSTRTWSQGRVTAVIILILAMFVVAGSVFWLMSGIGSPDSEVFVQPPPAEGGPAPAENPPAPERAAPVNPNPPDSLGAD